MNYTALAEKIRIWADALALTIGFSAPNIPEKHQIAMQNWLAAGYHGDMHFFIIIKKREAIQSAYIRQLVLLLVLA